MSEGGDIRDSEFAADVPGSVVKIILASASRSKLESPGIGVASLFSARTIASSRGDERKIHAPPSRGTLAVRDAFLKAASFQSIG